VCVRFGSHVLHWALTEDLRDDKEKLVFIALLRFVVETADGMPENIRKGQINANNNSLRSLLDACFYILYLVADDTSRRVLAYMYMDDRTVLKRQKRLLRGSAEHKEFATAHEKDRFLSLEVLDSTTQDIESIKAKIKEYETSIESPEYANIHAEFLRMKGLKQPPKHWYSFFDGPKDIRKLAEAVGMPGMYDVFFKRYSGTVHATEIIRGNIEPTPTGSLVIRPIRDSRSPVELTAMATQLMHTSFEAYLKTFIPSRVEELQAWHAKEIIAPYRRITNA
jgi:hypothetical protein